jgi:cytidylate kinase
LKIIISGLTAAGKTTHSKLLASELGFSYFSASQVLSSLTTGGGVWTSEVDEARTDDLDRKVDAVVLNQFHEHENCVFDAWGLPWMVGDSPCLRVWIESDLPSRARKVQVSGSEPGHEVVYEDALNLAIAKDEVSRSIFLRTCGFDLFEDHQVFDIVVDNSTTIERATAECAQAGVAYFGPILLDAVRAHGLPGGCDRVRLKYGAHVRRC